MRNTKNTKIRNVIHGNIHGSLEPVSGTLVPPRIRYSLIFAFLLFCFFAFSYSDVYAQSEDVYCEFQMNGGSNECRTITPTASDTPGNICTAACNAEQPACVQAVVATQPCPGSGTDQVGPSKKGPETVKLINPIGGTEKDPEGEVDIKIIIGNVIQKALALIGSITLLVFVVGGVMWLTSAGNEERVKKGSQTMLYAVIGIAVIFSSYAILNTIINKLIGAP